MAAAISLKEYLKKYESNTDETKKKKKKNKKKSKPEASGILVVDEDPSWQKPVELDDQEEEKQSEEEKPQVDEDIEVKRMKRLEAIRSRRPYHAISEDGSGWVSISDTSKLSESEKDLSPPRQRRPRFDSHSPEPKSKPSATVDFDLSPPRQKRKRHHTPSPDPEQYPLNSSNHNQDTSPSRRSRSQTILVSKERSPSPHSRAQAMTPDAGDLSPPRRSARPFDKDFVPSGDLNSQALSTNDCGLFPLQRRTMCPDKEDLSPPRRSRPQAMLSDKYDQQRSVPPDKEDVSLPRRSRPRVVSTYKEDLSPPRHSHTQEMSNDVYDLSPPRRARQRSPFIDSSRVSMESNIHPSRNGVKAMSSASNMNHSHASKDNKDVSFGIEQEKGRSGLFSKGEIKKEIERMKEKELARLSKMDPSSRGKGAEAVYRDKEGRQISKEEFLKLKQGEEKPKEKRLEWGKGLAQKREAEAREREIELEVDKPFARSRDDPELDKMLKERVRWGDPMAHLVKRKKPETILEDLGDDEKMKESGFIIPQTLPNHSWLKRGIDPIPNRYGIRPGRHWDGVDRSNGFEKDLFKRQNEKRATEREAYLWSVSEM